MNRDLQTMLWKEWKSLFRQRGNRMRVLLTLIAPIGMFGLFIPWDSGEHWLEDSPSLLASFAVPLIMILLTVPDSFAGERERHTLPTLLASRLSDRSILMGKACFSCILAMGMMVLTLALGLLTANLGLEGSGVAFYAPSILWMDLGLAVSITLLGVSAGVLVSLRAGTAQEAQQTLTALLFLPPTLLGPVVLLLGRARPEWQLKRVLAHLGPTNVFLSLFGVLMAIGIALAFRAVARFQRSRLIER